MSIEDTMYRLAELCEAITVKPVQPRPVRTTKDFRELMGEHGAMKAELHKQLEAEKNKSTMDKIKDKFQDVAKKLKGSHNPAHKEAVNKLINGVRAINCAITEEEEEQQKPKHWTQNQPSRSNMYYVNKFGKGRNKNNYQRGQDIIRGSYKNYKTNKELPKYLQDKELMNKAINILNHAYSQRGANIGRAFAAAQKEGIPRGVFHYLIQQRKQGRAN